MGKLSNAKAAVESAKTFPESEAAWEEVFRVYRSYLASELDTEYSVIRAALDDAPKNDATTAAHMVLRWCEDVNTRVLEGD